MSYTTDYYDIKSFSKLEYIWKDLERGKDMTCFQTYSWYKMLNECYVPEDSSNFLSIYAVVKNEDEVVLIAPLWIVKKTFKLVNKKGIFFLGRDGWSDYLNFIYKDFDNDAMSFLLEDLVKKYKVNCFYFSELKQNVQSYVYFNSKMKLKKSEKCTCVALTLPSTKEDYHKLLSKNARQNIRTAHNRIKKDGLEVRILFDDKNIDRERCRVIREQRFIEKFSHISKLRRMKYKIMHRLTFHFQPYLPFMCYNEGHFLTTYISNELCSFFYYLIDKNHRQIYVIAAGVNLEYSRYSPGIISLNAFINELIKTKNDIDIIDFTRGNEQYKYTVGGKEHYIEDAIFSL